MKKSLLIAGVTLLAMVFASCNRQHASYRTLPLDVLKDKIAGGWAGKMIGVTYGAPTEFQALGKTFEDSITWAPKDIIGAIWQDDLYVQLSFLMTMDTYGIYAPPKKFQEMFARAGFPLWHANVQARKNYYDSIFPPASGNPVNNLHADDIDFQIEADYIGFMCPGMPQVQMQIADSIGHIMNDGDGVYGGIFIGALYSAAYFENDVQKVIQTALQSIPAESDYAQAIRDVIRLHAQYPGDWRSAWREFQSKWGSTHICEAGSAFNIDAKVNGSYVVMGLLYGDGDPARTMEITVRCGEDSDCNPSNAMAVLGVMKGFSKLPDSYKEGIKKIGDSIFINTDYSFNKAVESTYHYALKLIAANGGKINDRDVQIQVELAKAPALEVSFPDLVFDKNIPVFDKTAWKSSKGWQVYRPNGEGNKPGTEQALYSDRKGDEISFTFNGTGVSIYGNWLRDCGKADVFLDGKFMRIIDNWYFHNGQEHQGMSLWHVTGLQQGDHTVELVVRGEKRPEATAAKVYISGAIVFKTLAKKNEGFKYSFED